jgi:hypothetical protein
LFMLDTLRGNHGLGGQLHVDHEPGPMEPGLWFADAVCGAVTRARAGEDHYLAMLKARISLIDL